VRIILAALALFSTACVAPEPDAQRIKEDLIGESASSPEGVWQFDSLGQFTALEILNVERSGAVLEYEIELELLRYEEDFKAGGSVTYAQDGRRWNYRSVALTELYSVNARAQLETVKTLRNLGTAYLSYMVDQDDFGGDGPRTDSPLTIEELRERLHPSEEFFYMLEVPERDGWGNALEFWVRPTEWPKYDVLIRSPGSDGKFESSVFWDDGAYPARRHSKDIVWADGYFLTWPGGEG
jgi:hypothetical protein